MNPAHDTPDDRQAAVGTGPLSGELLRHVLAAAGAGAWSWNFTTEQNVWSEEAYRLFGIPPGTPITPDVFYGCLHPDDREDMRATINAALAGLAPLVGEHRVCWPDGSVHSLRNVGGVERDGDGRPVRMSGVVLDVTAQREAEARVRAAETRQHLEAERIGRALISLKAGSFEWLAATDTIIWSDQLYRMHGLEPGSVPATRGSFVRFVHPDDRALLEERYARALAAESRFEYDHRVRWPDGTVRWLRNIGSIERDSAGNPVRMTGLVLDVSDQRDAAMQLRAAETRLARTVKLLNAGVFEYDLHANRTYWSDENFRLLGLEPGEVEPSADLFFERIHPADRQRNRETMERAIAGEVPLDDTHRIIRPDGEIRWMRGTGVVHRDEHGDASGFSGITLDVTDAMQAGIARQETADRLSRTLLALKAGVWELDLIRNVAYWSDENFRVFGLEPRSVAPSFETFISLIHPEDRELVLDAFQRVVSTEGPLSQVEHRVPMPDGTTRWLNHQGVVLRDEQGTPTNLWGITIDVTDRREAEEAVRRARASAERRSDAQAQVSRALSNARTLDEAIPAVMDAFGTQLEWDGGEVWLEDPSSGKLRFAASWMREGVDLRTHAEQSRRLQIPRGVGMVGSVWEEGQPQWVTNVLEHPRTLRKEMARAAGIHTSFAVPIIRRQGVVGVIQFFSRAIRRPDREIVNMFGSLGSQLGEFMERVATGEALRDSERQLRSVIETALDAVIGIDSQGVIVDWNPQAERIFGWAAEEVTGRPLDEVIIPAAYREAHRNGMANYRATGDGPVLNKRIELEALHRDGHVFPVEFSIAVLRPWQPAEPGSEVVQDPGAVFSAFIRDISERRRAEQAMVHAKDQAEATARAKSDFLAVMSHEIRTPLNGVMGMLNLLLKTDLTSAQREQLQTALRSADILLAVTNDALDFSKIEAGRLVIEQTPFDLDQLLDDVMGSVRPQVAAGVELRLTAAGQRPGAVIGDPTRLRQILVNLLGNAAKFTSAGHIALRVEADAPRDDGSIPFRFVVEDTGIGIPDEKHRSIFEAFTQAESSTTRRYGGTGLGLPIARQLAQLMDGTLRLAHSSPEGSVFELTLTLRPATVARTRTHAQRALTVAGHVLVVDDNQINRVIASAMLRHAGCTVEVATGGADALAQIEQRPFDLVFMDCQMPDMDGYETTRSLRARGYSPERLPVVAMTAAALAEDRERSFAAGMNDHLSKPVLEDALLEVLGRWLPHAAGAEPETGAAPAVDVNLSVLFNVKTVLRTRELMDEIPGSWDAMVESFVSHGRNTLDRLAAEVADARFDAVRRTAHNMKGTAAMIGAVRLSAWSADLEMAAQDSRTVLCSRLYLRLREEFDAVAQALQTNAF